MIVKMFSALPGAVGAFPEAAAASRRSGKLQNNCKICFAILRRPVEKSLKGLLGKQLYRPSCVAFCNIIYGIAIPAMEQWIRVAFAASAARQRSDGRIESKRSCSEIFMISEARSSLPAKNATEPAYCGNIRKAACSACCGSENRPIRFSLLCALNS